MKSARSTDSQIGFDHKEIGLLPARIDSALSLCRHEEHQRADNTRGQRIARVPSRSRGGFRNLFDEWQLLRDLFVSRLNNFQRKSRRKVEGKPQFEKFEQ